MGRAVHSVMQLLCHAARSRSIQELPKRGDNGPSAVRVAWIPRLARGITSLVKRIYSYLTLNTAHQAKRFRAGHFVITIRFEHLRYIRNL